ncbi:MAG: hypothetical protein JXR63_03690 [Spirochaetales bacterium]|nr:hypothetical protein [Spirochaetales bacterium]
MVSALVVRTIYFESDCFVMTYHLVGVRSLSFKKMFNEIVDISLYGDGIRSRLWISYKPNSRVSEPYDEIQSKLFSSNSEIPAQQIDFPFEVGIGLRQFLFQIIARLESADHQISVKSYKSGKSWVYSVGVDHEVEIPAGRDTWLID